MRMWLKLAAGLAAMAAPAALPEDAFSADAAHPAVVELFQSQGCSDCPPAVANVTAVSDRADVVALVFAIDYWDRLGWKDTFSKPEWTARQYAYARSLKSDGVYTPQVVVNGRVDGTGLDPSGLAALMSRGDRGAAGRRRRCVACSLRPARHRGCGQARRERGPHLAAQERRARDGPPRPMEGRGSLIP